MKTASAKSKGRALQKWMRQTLIEQLGIDPQDIESRSMGASGEDIMLARAAREKFPFSVECKNTESLNVWKSYEQAEANAGDYQPLLVIKKNGKKPLVAVDAEFFIKMLKEKNDS